jgi:hypothetical protein
VFPSTEAVDHVDLYLLRDRLEVLVAVLPEDDLAFGCWVDWNYAISLCLFGEKDRFSV